MNCFFNNLIEPFLIIYTGWPCNVS